MALAAAVLVSCGESPDAVGLVVADPTPWLQWGPAPREMRATAYFSDGTQADVRSAAAWASSDETVATVARGLVTRVATGHVVITGSFDGFSDSVELDVP